MRRLLSWIVLGLCVLGSPLVIFAAYRLFDMFAFWLIHYIPALEYGDELFGAASGFMALILAGMLALLSVLISIWLSISEEGIRYIVFGCLGFALAAAGFVWCAVSYIRVLYGLSSKGFSLDIRALKSITAVLFGYRLNIWVAFCTLVNQCIVSFVVMDVGKEMNAEKKEAMNSRIIFCSFSDLNDGALYPFACISGERMPLFSRRSLDYISLREYSNGALHGQPEMKEFAILICEAVSPAEAKCIKAVKARKFGEHNYDYDEKLLSDLNSELINLEDIPLVDKDKIPRII